MMPFFCFHISQGSVTTLLKRGGIFKHEFVANLPPSRLLKKFENRSIFGEVMAKSLVSCFFDSRCSFTARRPVLPVFLSACVPLQLYGPDSGRIAAKSGRNIRTKLASCKSRAYNEATIRF